ncbi:MAG: carbon-nitrogen hydrolase family protein [Pseudomonadales bacterium]|nr:carbon-nitrogen hydrolase family protein [Pseudomonadales bacterium]
MTCIAAIQMVSGDQVETNLNIAQDLVREATEQGAQLVVLPENFALLSTAKLQQAGEREVSSSGPIRHFVSNLARDYKVWIVAGSIPVAARPDGHVLDSRVRAACFVFDDQGREVSRYDKIHLFDVDVADSYGSYRESDSIEPGELVQLVETPFGRIGLSICYDLRFPELFRLLLDKGVEIITVPSAFTAVTGAAHWEVLLRARAIENLCYAVGANQGGRHSKSRETFGHSMIIDPWGRVLAKKEKDAGIVLAKINLDYLKEVRARMPVAQHRRLWGRD